MGVAAVGDAAKVLETKPARPGSPDYYRKRASEMLDQAARAVTEEGRTQFLLLAEHWEYLAQVTEHPNW